MVADQQQLRPGRARRGGGWRRGGGVGHGGLVDHDQVPGVQPPRPRRPRRRGRPARRRAGPGWRASGLMLRAVRPSPARTSVAICEVASPNTRRGLPAHRCGVGPGAGDRADDERLAGAGRPDQRLDPRAGGEHAAHGGGLVGAELDPGLAQLVEEPAAAPASAARPRRARAVGGDAGRVRCARAPCGRVQRPAGADVGGVAVVQPQLGGQLRVAGRGRRRATRSPDSASSVSASSSSRDVGAVEARRGSRAARR